MTVTEIATEGNISQKASSWGDGIEETCWRTITRCTSSGRYYQSAVCCKYLNCPTCGPKKRLRAYEEAVLRHAQEPEIWVVYVPAHVVDRLRKTAGRIGEPIESIPVSDDWNVVISPHRFDGAVQLSPDEMKDLYITHRVARRQHARSGRWAPKKVKDSGPDGETLSREFISPEAFRNVGKAVGAMIVESGANTRYFDAPGYDPQHMKRLMLKEEERIRRKRLKDRGVVERHRWSYLLAA